MVYMFANMFVVFPILHIDGNHVAKANFLLNGRSISKDPGWPRLRGPWRRRLKQCSHRHMMLL